MSENTTPTVADEGGHAPNFGNVGTFSSFLRNISQPREGETEPTSTEDSAPPPVAPEPVEPPIKEEPKGDQPLETTPEPSEEAPKEEKEDSRYQKLLQKYGTNEKIADAYRHLLIKNQGTAEERNKLAEVINSHFEIVNGELKLRADVAARALSSFKGASLPEQPVEATKEQILKEVEDEFRKAAEEKFVKEDVPAVLEAWKPQIEKAANDRYASVKAEIAKYDADLYIRVTKSAEQYAKNNPSDKDLLPHFDEFYNLIEDGDERIKAFLQNLPMDKVAPYIRAKVKMADAIKEAFDEGFNAGKTSVQPSDGSRPSSKSGDKNVQPTMEDEFKQKFRAKSNLKQVLFGSRER